MSLDATTWAWKQELKASQKLVLLSLADRANENHVCFPSLIRLTKDTCLNKKTIIKVIKELQAAGILSVKKEQGNVNFYHLIGVDYRHEPVPKTVPLEVPETVPVPKTAPVPKTVPEVVPETVPDQYQKRHPNLSTTSQGTLKHKNNRSNRFSDWWNLYPRKIGKKDCEKIWKLRKLDSMADEIIADVKNRILNDQKWIDGFIPNPKTYLNGDRWEDEIQAKKTTQENKHANFSERDYSQGVEEFGKPDWV